MRIMTMNIWGDYFGNPVDVRIGGILETIKKAHCKMKLHYR